MGTECLRCNQIGQIHFRLHLVVFAALPVVLSLHVSNAMSTHSPLLAANDILKHETTLDSVNEVTLKCNYKMEGPMYICRLNKVNFTKDAEVTSVSGTHLNGKTNADVRGIHFQSGEMDSLPNGIGNFFKNIVALVAGEDYQKPLTLKTVNRTSLKQLNKVELLSIFTTAIVGLENDAFWDLPNLRDFLLSGTGTIVLNEKLFQKNERIKEIVLLGLRLTSIPATLFENNAHLRAVYLQNCDIQSVDENVFTTNKNLNLVSIRSNKIQSLPKNLFKNNLLLEVIDFSENILKTIDIDFTKFELIDSIDLEDNVCIDAYFEADSHRFVGSFNNMTEFQSVISKNCTSHLY
ncbi:Leucine-rich repeat-containing protein 15 [Pseudolycoriella hygida]|uniref:Leucine-rich repeat-containing protein 15 n=1 Tax=Pseudolycoriella hygida TaxID=35572 RepID=A0A9Q0NCH5_9DIPT|nr:Leucine-rich repeat-containing protein 15 [Pseudolycoriella hygida]